MISKFDGEIEKNETCLLKFARSDSQLSELETVNKFIDTRVWEIITICVNRSFASMKNEKPTTVAEMKRFAFLLSEFIYCLFFFALK